MKSSIETLCTVTIKYIFFLLFFLLLFLLLLKKQYSLLTKYPTRAHLRDLASKLGQNNLKDP